MRSRFATTGSSDRASPAFSAGASGGGEAEGAASFDGGGDSGGCPTAVTVVVVDACFFLMSPSWSWNASAALANWRLPPGAFSGGDVGEGTTVGDVTQGEVGLGSGPSEAGTFLYSVLSIMEIEMRRQSLGDELLQINTGRLCYERTERRLRDLHRPPSALWGPALIYYQTAGHRKLRPGFATGKEY